jgi:hypothetical protein|tara:strand:+ start:356 stop:472 length:117 start_codon:yes stop_codon:yes gene_type:complete
MEFFDKEKQEEAILFALHDYNKLRLEKDWINQTSLIWL